MLLTLFNNLNNSPQKAVSGARAPLVFPRIPVKYPEILQPQPLAEDIPAPAQNVYLDGVTRKAWPNPDTLNPPDLIPAVIVNQFDTLPAKAKFSSECAVIVPDLIANLPPNLFDLPAPKKLAQDELLPNVAANTPPAVVQSLTVRGPLIFLPRPPVFNFWETPQILPYLPIPPPPSGPVAAGRHHKRYKVKLDGRTVYFATKAEAYAARERHRAGVILEAKAAGVPLTKVRLRRAPIRAVPDERHPEELRPAAQIAAPDPMEAVRLAALKEARMREEEEIAIALLLLH